MEEGGKPVKVSGKRESEGEMKEGVENERADGREQEERF